MTDLPIPSCASSPSRAHAPFVARFIARFSSRVAGTPGRLRVLALAAALHAGWAAAQTPYPATLAGHAVMPANSLIDAPADAPADLSLSGKFTTGVRVEAPGTVEGRSAGRPTGIGLPLRGQPLQGHSGIKRMADGTFWVLTDNGFGSKANSPDAMLFLNRYAIDFAAGTMKRLETVFLRDPDRKVPFRIVHEGTTARYLTGADFDTESFQFAGGHLWIGDEFGPYLIKADLSGKVLAVFETRVEGRLVRSPDHPAITTPAVPGGDVKFEVRRSKGYEGMAASPDGKRLYAMLEGPLWDDGRKAWESAGGRPYLRVLEFDVAAERWTGRFWTYPLEADHHAIGDFNLIDATHGLVIERDNGEGTPDKACPAGQTRPDCFHDLPRFKRVYKIEISDANVGGPVRKIAYIDLLNIADPNGRARKPLVGGVFSFPFFTIENVDRVDDRHIVVGNDNNLPFSSSRDPMRADDNEMILLEVGDFLKAR